MNYYVPQKSRQSKNLIQNIFLLSNSFYRNLCWQLCGKRVIIVISFSFTIILNVRRPPDVYGCPSHMANHDGLYKV